MVRVFKTPYQRRKAKSNLLAKKSSRQVRCLVSRSNKYTYLQVISHSGDIHVSFSDKLLQGSTKTEKSLALGLHVGSLMKEKGLSSAVFDRNGFVYHGRIRAVCEGLRQSGIQI